jgi:hypothetical protein
MALLLEDASNLLLACDARQIFRRESLLDKAGVQRSIVDNIDAKLTIS